MSGLFFLGLLAIWLFAGWIVYMIWRLLGFDTTRKLVWKVVHMMIGVVLLSAWFAAGFWPFAGKKMYYDAQVREMCEKDGGITIYETVTLPANYFNQWGQPNFYDPIGGEYALGNEYTYKENKTMYRDKDPAVSRREYRVFRRDDGKLLGKSITYVRGGGDIPGPWHPSSFRCPKEGGVIPLFVKIFQQSEIK
jgi:hypothetical protein